MISTIPSNSKAFYVAYSCSILIDLWERGRETKRGDKHQRKRHKVNFFTYDSKGKKIQKNNTIQSWQFLLIMEVININCKK